MRAVVLTTVLCLLTVPISAFQVASNEDSRLCSIEGRVIESKSGEPIKRALVILKQGNEPGTGAYTNAAGKFLFREIKPGAYMLFAEHDGFVEDPASAHTTIQVKAGNTESEVALKLVRTGAVSGIVLDAEGEPVTGANVQVMSASVKKGPGRPGSWASTNDRGEYRAFDVAPGKYRIAVSRALGTERHPDLRMRSVAEEAYATTYYPNTVDARDAVIVQVEPGADLQGINVQLHRARAVWIRGRVTGPGGVAPGFVMVNLNPNRDGGQNRNAIVNPSNGEFELRSVLPGRYVLSAETPMGQATTFTARRILEVGETDIEGVSLALAPPQTLSGRVVAPEGRKLPAGLIVALVPREHLNHQGGGMAQLGGDENFTMPNVAPGDYDVIIGNTGPGDDLYISSIRIGDTDALAEGIHVAGAPLPPLEIKLKPNGGMVECLVSDANQKPVPEAHVTLIPDAPRRSQRALYGDCRTDAEGKCAVLGVTPGAYHIFAFAIESELDLGDPESLKDFEKYGKSIKVAEGDKQKLEVNVIPEENLR